MNHRKHHLVLALLLATFICLIAGLSVSAAPSPKYGTVANFATDLSWTVVASPVTDTLSSIAMVSANYGWAGGENGTLVHYDGSSWLTYTLPLTTTLFSVDMSSSHNGWAVGMNSAPPYNPVLLRYDGADWQSIPVANLPWLMHLSDVSVPNETSAWIAGGVIVCSAGPPCQPVAAFGGFAYWDGNIWTYMQISNVNPSSLSMISDTDGWAVGTEVLQPSYEMRSVILHWDGHEWTRVDHPMWLYPPGNYLDILAEVSALNANNAWVSVTNGSAFLHWDGLNWSEVFNPVRGTPSIGVVSTNDAWAVGSYGDIGSWDGMNWSTVSSPVTDTLTSISMISSNEAWAVGTGGTILYGTNFTQYLPLSVK